MPFIYVTDSYQIATMGYNFTPESLASLGVLYQIEITEIPPDGGVPPADFGSVGMGAFEVKKSKEKKKKFKIKVTVKIDGQTYVEEKIIEDIKEPKVEDVKITVLSEEKPKIQIEMIN